MILPDTNIWIDHLHRPDPDLTALLIQKRIRLHPFVLGEISLGLVGSGRGFIKLFGEVRHSKVASQLEMLNFIDARQLFGTGIGYVDAHLLASTVLENKGKLWTRDKRLLKQAQRLEVAYTP
jgi:predicted nucleic acid-binding protein